MKKLVIFMLGLLLCFCAGAREDRYDIRGAKGNLVTLVRIPDGLEGADCPVVILFHGFNDHKDASMFRMFADSLECHGIASVRFDFNGHGESDGEFRDMTIPNELADADSIYNFVRSLPFTGSVSFLGHSQGGVIAAMMAGIHASEGIRSVVLLAPAANLRDCALVGDFFGHVFDPENVPETLAFNNGATLMGREYILSARDLPIYETARLYPGPVCIVQSRDDRLVPYTCGLYFHEGYADSEIHLLTGADHSFFPDQVHNLKPALDFLIK